MQVLCELDKFREEPLVVELRGAVGLVGLVGVRHEPRDEEVEEALLPAGARGEEVLHDVEERVGDLVEVADEVLERPVPVAFLEERGGDLPYARVDVGIGGQVLQGGLQRHHDAARPVGVRGAPGEVRGDARVQELQVRDGRLGQPVDALLEHLVVAAGEVRVPPEDGPRDLGRAPVRVEGDVVGDDLRADGAAADEPEVVDDLAPALLPVDVAEAERLGLRLVRHEPVVVDLLLEEDVADKLVELRRRKDDPLVALALLLEVVGVLVHQLRQRVGRGDSACEGVSGRGAHGLRRLDEDLVPPVQDVAVDVVEAASDHDGAGRGVAVRVRALRRVHEGREDVERVRVDASRLAVEENRGLDADEAARGLEVPGGATVAREERAAEVDRAVAVPVDFLSVLARELERGEVEPPLSAEALPEKQVGERHLHEVARGIVADVLPGVVGEQPPEDLRGGLLAGALHLVEVLDVGREVRDRLHVLARRAISGLEPGDLLRVRLSGATLAIGGPEEAREVIGVLLPAALAAVDELHYGRHVGVVREVPAVAEGPRVDVDLPGRV